MVLLDGKTKKDGGEEENERKYQITIKIKFYPAKEGKFLFRTHTLRAYENIYVHNKKMKHFSRRGESENKERATNFALVVVAIK